MTDDLNFCFPVHDLENDRVKLTPFIPSTHADAFFAASAPHPELYACWLVGPYPSAAAFVADVIHARIRPDPGSTLFAILDKTRIPPPPPGAPPPPLDPQTCLAGVIGLMNTSPAHLSTEIGYLLVLPPFQRTHVTATAAGLLLRYALDLPAAGGLGLRRVQWQAASANARSVAAAERLGFRREALVRWGRVLPEGKRMDVGGSGAGVGAGARARRGGDPMEGREGVDVVCLAVCWDEWEEGGRELVRRQMERRE